MSGQIPDATIRGTSGLWSSPNPFSKVPEGALTIGDEIVLRAAGVVESRRGFSPKGERETVLMPIGDTRVIAVGGSASGISAMDVYDTAIDNEGGFPIGGTSTKSLPPYFALPTSAYKMSAANKSILMTTSTGTMVIGGPRNAGLDDDNWIQRYAGIPQPPAPQVSLIAAAGNALMNTAKRRTYRVTLAAYDTAGNFFESPPSEPVWVENTSGVDKTPQITLVTPLALQQGSGLGGNFTPFFRIWRSLETAIGVSANDEMFLIREYVPALWTFIGGLSVTFVDPSLSFTFNDVSIDSLLNVPLYTNPQTGDGFGITSANTRPPTSGAIAYFKSRMYYGRNTYQQTLTLQIIGTGTGGVAPGDTITIDGITYTAGGAGLESFGVFNAPSAGGPIAVPSNIETTAKSLIECIRRAYNTLAGSGYSRQINRQLYAWYASSDVSDFGRIVIERPLPVPLQDDPGIVFTAATVSPGIRFPGGSTTSADDYIPGGLSWSKPNEPEAVPNINFTIVGDANKAVLGFSVHRNSMIIYKEDGAFILRDNGGPIPQIDLLDASVVCIAPATIQVVSNIAYLLAQRGVVACSEQGTDLMSGPIWEDLDKLYRTNATQLATAFGVGHESERLYILAVPASANERGCSLQYVLRIPDMANPLPVWSRWRLPGLLCGCVVPATNQLVFGFSAPWLANAPGLISGIGTFLEKRGGVVSTDFVDSWKSLPSLPAPGSTASAIALTGDYRPWIGTGDAITYNPGGPRTKVYTPRVTAVSYASGTNKTTLTLDRSYPFTGGNFSTLPAIRCHWRYAPITLGAPTVEKQWQLVQAFFEYCDADWVDFLIDSETAQIQAYSQVPTDPLISNLGGTAYTSTLLPGQAQLPGPASPAQPLSSVQWLRNCRDVILRCDPSQDSSRACRLGVDIQFAQAGCSFRMTALAASPGETNESGTR